jgi:hypothetical protein
MAATHVGAHVDSVPVTTGRGSLLLSFSGLIPVALAVPILMLHLYGFGIVISVVSSTAVIVYHRYRGQGVTALDVAALLFGVLSGALYFGLHNTALPEHLGTVFYVLLAGQVAWSAVRGTPWTLQYARRSAPPEQWSAPAFVAGNWAASALWGASFLGCTLISVLASGLAFGVYLPLALLAGAALATHPLARRYGHWSVRHARAA